MLKVPAVMQPIRFTIQYRPNHKNHFCGLDFFLNKKLAARNCAQKNDRKHSGKKIGLYRAPGDKKQQDMGLDVGTRNDLLSVRRVHTYLYR